jgi:hypothetical protein
MKGYIRHIAASPDAFGHAVGAEMFLFPSVELFLEKEASFFFCRGLDRGHVWLCLGGGQDSWMYEKGRL